MNAVQKIPIQYHCQRCGLSSECQVTARESPNIDIKRWMNKVTNAVNADHQIKSFLCESRHVDLMIPLGDENDTENWIGKAPTCQKS